MPLKELDAHPELRDDPAVKDFNDLPTFVKSYKETKQFVGSSLRPPGPDASPETRKEFYEKLQKHAPDLVPLRLGDADAEKLVWDKLGRPSKRDEYAFKVPDGVDINLEGLRDAAEAAGMTKSQFERLATKAAEGAQKMALASQQETAGLKAEWGAAYDGKLKSAAAVALKLGMSETEVGAIMAGRMSATALRRWDAIAAAIGTEGKGVAGQATGAATGLTPAEAQARFREIQVHPAYFDKNHPEHDVYAAKGFELMKQLHPD